MSARILGLGTSIPPDALSQKQSLALAQTYCGNTRKARALEMVYRHCGIESRHSVIAPQTPEAPVLFFPKPESGLDRGPGTAIRLQRYEKEIVPLAIDACRLALQDAHASSSSITHLIVVTCTGFFAPGLDVALIKALELRPTIGRTQIGFMGCHGALNGLQIAQALVNSCADARVLICAAELCSLHMQYGDDSGSAVANALFSDGAAAAVLGNDSGVLRNLIQVAGAGSCLIPDSEDAMSWRIGDHGFQMTLSPAVPVLIQEHLAGWMENWLGQHGLAIANIESWAVHPGGPRILDAVEESLKLPASALAPSREILAHYGNMSSPTVLFILEKLRGAARMLPKPCALLGFGPGLIVEAALLV